MLLNHVVVSAFRFAVVGVRKDLFSFHTYVVRSGSDGFVSPRRVMSSPPQPEVGVAVFPLKGNKVLMGCRRTAIGCASRESFEDCVAREVKEETGLDITGIELGTITNNELSQPKPAHLIAVLMRAVLADPTKMPINRKPEKCDGWEWHDWSDLPKPLFGPLETAIRRGLNPCLRN